VVFSFTFPLNLEHFFLLSHAFHMPRPFGDEYKLWISSSCNFLHSPVTSSLLGPNIHLRTLSSNTLRLCSSLNVRDQVSHPYKTVCEPVCSNSYNLVDLLLRNCHDVSIIFPCVLVARESLKECVPGLGKVENWAMCWGIVAATVNRMNEFICICNICVYI
jgi:hypothetical protein